MNFLVDCGNSFIKWTLVPKEQSFSEDKCLVTEITSLSSRWKEYGVPDRVIVANVAGENVAAELRKIVIDLWQLEAEFPASSNTCCGVLNSYLKPEQLGIDRWLAMIAAYQDAKGAVIVIDCGTAVTIDLVNDEGVFVGGVILPGMDTALKSLDENIVAACDSSDKGSASHALARSTNSAIQTGIIYGLAGGIDRVIKEQSSEVHEELSIYLTGGDAEKIEAYLTTAVNFQPALVLQGLQILASQS